MYGIISFVTIALALAPAWALDRAGGAVTIPALVERALARSELIIAAGKAAEAAKWERLRESAWQNPSLSAAAGRKSAGGDGGVAFDLGVTQPFYFPGKRALMEEIGAVQERLAGLDRDEAELFVRFSVVRLAYRYAIAREMESHLAERIERFRIIRRYLAGREFPSPRKRIEKHIVEMRLALMQRDLAGIQSERDIIWARLNLFAGFEDKVDVSVAWLAKGKALSRDALAASAEKGNIDLKKRALVLEKIGAETRLAKKSALPDFSVSLLYGEERLGVPERFIGAGVSIGLPVWNRNAEGVKGLEARGASEKARLDNARRETSRDLLTACIEYETSCRSLELLPVGLLESVHGRMADADDAFRKGLIDLVTYSEVEAQSYETHLAVFGAQMGCVEKYTALLVIQGSKELDPAGLFRPER